MQKQKKRVGHPIKHDRKSDTEMKAEWRKKLKANNPAKYKETLAADAKRKRDAKAENKPKGLSTPERVEVSQLKKQNKALETQKGKLEAEVAGLKAANVALKKAKDDFRDEADKHKAALTKLLVA